jgi:hypothetical protein
LRRHSANAQPKAMMQAGAQIAASQTKITKTNCAWLGNTLSCTTSIP